VGAVMLEHNEHWKLESRQMFSLDSMAAIPPAAEELPTAEPSPAATS
jgi:hypothetical protein